MTKRKNLGKGLGKGYKNILNTDPAIHSMSAKGIKQKKSMNQMPKKEPVKLDLSYAVIDVKPRSYDFWENKYAEDWDIAIDRTEEEMENEDFMPMMNYIYPLPDNFEVPDDVKDKLNNTTIVEIEDEYFLALTGGGMDLSWEICESYINLGYYPPAHFCDLPAMAGRGKSARDKKIIQACKESLKALSGRHDSAIRRLESIGED
jgi:hypothetical protein